MIDLLITGGSVVDGTGADAYPADVAVVDDEVVAIGRELSGDASAVIDATGKTVTPGFIDLHSHSDLSFLIDNQADSKLRQGVTLELCGNCGSSYGGPLVGDARNALAETLVRSGWSLDAPWLTFEDYLGALATAGSTINLAAQVGHGTIRRAVMGMAAREPSAAELSSMVGLAGEALDAGALGLSTGLWYAPGSYARPSEIEAIARETARRGRLYSSHVRSESDQGQGVFAAHREAIDIGRRTGARAQISHIKMVGTEFRGRGPELLQQIDVARDEGVDVAADIYPYSWSATSLSGALLPRWVLADGREAMLSRLRDPTDQRRLRAEIERGLARYQGPAGVVISRYPPNPDIEGLSLEQIAVAGRDPFEAVVGLITEGDGSVVVHAIDEEDMTTFSMSAHVAVASDGNSLRATGPLSTGAPHPRSYGTFPRFLALMASPNGPLRFEEAIRKMTSLPAQRLGLRRSGRIGVGAAADLVVIDHAALADKSSYQDPHRYPSGVEHVIVNGRIALTHGQPTGVLAGRVIRSPAG